MENAPGDPKVRNEFEKLMSSKGKTLNLGLTRKSRVKKCLKCGQEVILENGFFLCESCRRSNSHLEDFGDEYRSYFAEAFKIFKIGQQQG